MKRATVLFVVVLMFACVYSDKKVNPTIDEMLTELETLEGEDCKVSRDAFEDQLNEERRKRDFCFQSVINGTGLKDDVDGANTTEEFRVVTKKYCGMVPELRECISSSNSTKYCLSDKFENLLTWILNSVNKGVNYTCAEAGEPLAHFLREDGRDFWPLLNQRLMSNCNRSPSLTHDMDYASAVRGLHNWAKNASECFLGIGSEETPTMGFVAGLANVMINELKCVDSSTGETIDC